MGVSMETAGRVLILTSALFLVFASYITLFHVWLPPSDSSWLQLFTRDAHYKYFALLLVPTGAYFVIANWVGWQYYRNA
ncbi:hypothetical protein DL93DRAFT_2062653 [Clavulina sp. PMI_390]|nr:hypothetical protein DL93DRAFT_2062653 [Clavulina sp. PMI_390]